MSKLSIVVPVYNVEKYIRHCVESLQTQTMKEIEIILVDDGSTDKSGIICDEYQKDDARIITIHKKNEGVSNARKVGIKKATSEYICFLDSDDYCDKTFCETMYNVMISKNADIVECDYIRFFDKTFKNIKLYSSPMELNRNDFMEQIVKHTIVDGDVPVVLWNKIYKKTIIEKYVKEYGENLLEDYIFNMQYYQGVQKYIYINTPLIYYRQRAGSITSLVDNNVFNKLLKVQRLKENIMDNLNMNNVDCLQLSYNWFYKYIKSAVVNMMVKQDKTYFNYREYIYNIINNDEFYRIVSNINSDNIEIKLLQNKKYDKYIDQLKRQAVLRRNRVKLARIKHKIKMMV